MTVVLALDNPSPETGPRSTEHDHPPMAERPSRAALVDLRADRLSYMADMINELQVMAHETQCHTLAGILRLAHAEARQQMHGRSP